MVVEDIKDKIGNYILHKGLPSNKFFTCLNPNHEDKNPSMRFNSHAKNVHCFSCGATYDIFDLIGMDYNFDNFKDQYNIACKLYGIDGKVEYKSFDLEKKSVKDDGYIDYTKELDKLYSERDMLSSYMINRGISMENIDKYRIFELDGKIYFPIFDDNKCIGWTSRIIEAKSKTRYINSKGSLGIWNSDYLKQKSDGQNLYITEGIVDALSIEEHGGRAIAVCGVGNAGKLIKYCEKNINTSKTWNFVICFDPDQNGGKIVNTLKLKLEKLQIKCRILELDDGDIDINHLHITNKEKLMLYLNSVSDFDKTEEGNHDKYPSAADSLDDFFKESLLRGTIGGISTGFKSMDKLLGGGLFPGLYVVGGTSSVGKTSFMLQIADYLSQCGNDIIYISLEQSRHELIAKSLSRISAMVDDENSKKNAFITREILNYTGEISDEKRLIMEKAINIYQKNALNLFIFESEENMDLKNILILIKDHIKHRNKKPILIVDYLQIIASGIGTLTDKQRIDGAVVELKRISRDFDIPVMVVSSFNRESYKCSVSMESFKESGAVEYSADVLVGIQIKGVGKKDFDINLAKMKNPRELEMVILKNRNGTSYGKVEFKYDSRYNLIWENRAKKFLE